MNKTLKGIAILGSTGSIGTQSLDIVRAFPEHFSVTGLACDRNISLLQSQILEFKPHYFSCNGIREEIASLQDNGCRESDLETIVEDPDVDIVVTATTGDVAIGPTLKAIDAGKHIALANKETVVMAGDLVSSRAKKARVPLLPLDSEPNAIWQCIRGEDSEVSRLIITASGGAFRTTPLERLANATPRQALKHPTWSMGSKITVDSATMMNKAFEVIESHWLFGVPWENIEVVIHPESYIHSMVEFVDGSIKAQISPPDMHLPIQYALFYPERISNAAIKKFNPVETGTLTFKTWESERYPCFDMALKFAKLGGTWPAALVGANDAAVELFLNGKIGFLEIGVVIEQALEHHTSNNAPTLEDITQAGKTSHLNVIKLVGG